MKMKYVYSIFVVVLLFSSCNDQIDLTVKNESGNVCKIGSHLIEEQLTIENGKEATIFFSKAKYSFRIHIVNDHIDKWYRFDKVNKWFGLVRKAELVITENELFLSSYGKTRLGIEE
jgi:hypothetical protein